jgi:hypothetical protein
MKGSVSINDLPVDFDMKMRLAQMVRRFEDSANKRESDQAKADPKTHKLTRVMEGKYGMRYWWIPCGKDGLGRKVYFCWTKHRNAAGYFLGWRETYSVPKGKQGRQSIKRDQWIARKAKWRAKEVCERRAARFKAKHQPTA